MKTRNVIKILIIGLTVMVGYFGVKLGIAAYGYHEAETVYDDISKTASVNETFDFNELKNDCKDVVGWIRSKDTVIDYPIVSSIDNLEYLTMLPNGDYSNNGSIFTDYRCEEPFEGFNTVIHGHHMKDGSMFCSLENYENQEYYEAHEMVEILTPETEYELIVISSFVTKAESATYEMNDMTEVERAKFIKYIKGNSDIETGEAIDINDKLVTLSTCSYDYENARRVVIGKLIKKT